MHGGRVPPAAKPRHTPASSDWPEEPAYYHGYPDGGYTASAYLPEEPWKLLPDKQDGTEAETAMAPANEEGAPEHQAAGADEPAAVAPSKARAAA
jgi:hypothetical protein